MSEQQSTSLGRPQRDIQYSTDSEASYAKENPEVERLEGGTDAWLTVVGSFLIYYSSYGVLNSFGFFQDYYENDLLKSTSTSPATISFIGTLQIATMNAVGSISGALCDAYGIKYLYIFSGLGTAGSFLALSFCKPVVSQLFLGQGLFMGLSIAMAVQPAYTVVGQHFEKKRALAGGIICAGSAAGGLCFSLMFATLNPLLGFPTTMRIAALKVLVCFSIALKISKSKPTGKKVKFSTLLDFRGFLDYRYAVLAAGAWLTYLGLWIPGYHIRSYTSSVYPGSAVGKYIIPLMNSCGIPAMIIGGFLGDQFGCLNILCPMAFAAGLLCLSLWLLAPAISALVLFACFFGFTSGALVPLMSAAVSQITPSQKIGARIGAFYSLVAVASLVGPPIGGALVGSGSKTKEAYRGLIVFLGATMLAASLVLFAGRLLHGKNLRARW
ncbi:MFS general substrate transporter [Byssothecium circinans]|uniref:MFS general substrate transporter n=1 Tax=Byssothecium circinans TaxID=147558 RepID=A0A6A5UCI8_9PLEO|nr:MFS general substrate transporter [Byssothecium circinans]